MANSDAKISLHADGQLLDDLAQIGLRGLEVVLLLPQEAVPLLHTLKFVHRIQIDVAERPHFHAQLLHAAARFTRVFQSVGRSLPPVWGVNS